MCNEQCHLKDISKNCEIKCQKLYNHSGEHECNVVKHYCNKECSLKQLTRDGCNGECILDAGHYGECICLKDKNTHICNGICYMHNLRECQINCVLPTNHEGKHQCKTPKEDHLCDKECSLKDSKRTINGKKCSALCL